MIEIELKARVSNRLNLINVLDEKATFVQKVSRDDIYYKSPAQVANKIRIRTEKKEIDGKSEESYLVTYKKKENRQGADGTITEVNEEHECSISDPKVLQLFLEDSAFTVDLTKHKDVMDWSYTFDSEGKTITANLELCNIPPLGDFLEIEILSPTDEEKTVKFLQTKLLEILLMVGLSKEDIETRYYSELLKSRLP